MIRIQKSDIITKIQLIFLPKYGGNTLSPVLFTQIQQKQLEKLLKCLYYCLELPISALDESGDIICEFGRPISFCRCFKKMLPRQSAREDSCQKLHAEAGRRAMKSGTPFIFSCHASLRHLSFPLNSGKQRFGSILVGPFLTEEPEPDMFVDISKRYSPEARELLELYKEAESVPRITPERAEQISWLISYLFSPYLSPETAIPHAMVQEEERETDRSDLQNGTDVIEKAITYMKQHYNQHLTLKETAGHVELNPSYFSTLFKQSCGSSFKEYLNYIRIEEGKKLLAGTDISILDIAIAIGFEDQSYFTKVFKKYTGLTPKQYRG